MWRVINKYQPEFLLWNGDMYGPSTAAVVRDGIVVFSTRDGLQFIYDNVDEAARDMPERPDVCLSESLAVRLNCPLVYGEHCLLDYVSWSALGTGIASPFGTAHVLKLMITARRCRVRLRRIQAGQLPARTV